MSEDKRSEKVTYKEAFKELASMVRFCLNKVEILDAELKEARNAISANWKLFEGAAGEAQTARTKLKGLQDAVDEVNATRKERGELPVLVQSLKSSKGD